MSEAEEEKLEKTTTAPTDADQPVTSAEETLAAETSHQSVSDAHSQVCAEGEGEDRASSEQAYDVEPSSQSAFHMGEEPCVDPEIVRQLTDGFLQRFLPPLEQSKSSISEILNNQTVVIETLEQENAKFKDCTAHLDLSAMMIKAKNYHTKLLNIKRDMAGLHEKSAKLKKRALRLQQQKQREELQRAHREERELEKEQMLTARVASPET